MVNVGSFLDIVAVFTNFPCRPMSGLIEVSFTQVELRSTCHIYWAKIVTRNLF
jgi:hypothetical protein